jgi:hypothetical protein
MLVPETTVMSPLPTMLFMVKVTAVWGGMTLSGVPVMVASTEGDTPVAPVIPVAPVTPVDPVGPVFPVAPVGPVAPVTPVDPVAPVVPVAPVIPVAPVQLLLPVLPVLPVQDVHPVGQGLQFTWDELQPPWIALQGGQGACCGAAEALAACSLSLLS